MDHGQLSMVADKFQWVFSESLLNTCGKDVKFCRRTADHHAVSIRTGSDGDLCQPACRDTGRFLSQFQCALWYPHYLQSLL